MSKYWLSYLRSPRTWHLGQHHPGTFCEQNQIPEITQLSEAEIWMKYLLRVTGNVIRCWWIFSYMWSAWRTGQSLDPAPTTTQSGYSSFSREVRISDFVILRNREGQITEIIVTDRFENLAPPASKEYHHHPRRCFQFSELIDSLIALTSLDPSQLVIIYLQRVRVRPSFQSRDQGIVNT